MRYRVKDYTVYVYQDNARVYLTVPSTLIEASPSFTTEERRKVTEAIRLIIDETAGVVFCSSMQKDNIIQMQAQNNQDGTTEIAIYFAIPTGKTIASTDQFTIEMDWGDTPGASPSADQLAEFFGVTLLQGYEFMTDTEVTDELEEIMQAIDPELTAEQAASITAEAMQIINHSQS